MTPDDPKAGIVAVLLSVGVGLISGFVFYCLKP